MKRHTAEEIIPKLRQAEADVVQGLTIAQICQRYHSANLNKSIKFTINR